MYIEDCMVIWRKQGKSWDEINKLRKQKPFCCYPSSTHEKLWKEFLDNFQISDISNTENMPKTGNTKMTR
jgi:hypothetical protein